MEGNVHWLIRIVPFINCLVYEYEKFIMAIYMEKKIMSAYHLL